MQTLTGQAQTDALRWLEEAAVTARNSTCCRRRCGSVLVRNGKVLGAAWNGLPGKPGQSKIHCTPYAPHLKTGFKSDKTCCIHAEERLVMEALRDHKNLAGSIMYFASVDEEGNRLPSGQPSCTICSKMALEGGVESWVLEHESGITLYESAEYNQLSFEYKGEAA